MNTTNLPSLSFLDVETTGLSAAYDDRVCEIAVLRLDPDGAISEFQSLVNPCRLLSPGASAVNGITNAMVEEAPKFAEIASELLEIIKDSVLVFHNAPFDLSFINMEFEKCGIEMPNLRVIDTLLLARKHFNFPSNKLGSIADHFGINMTQKHRALADVATTHKIFLQLWEELANRGIANLEEIISGNSVSRSK